MIKEWNLLRTIACLSIVFLHSMTKISGYGESSQIEYYNLVRIFLCYATPTFLVLSVIILANRYPQSLPDQFWSKRFKWLYVPFLSFGVIDALTLMHTGSAIDLQQKLIDNLAFGRYEGWFVLVILQFYVLHYLVTRFKVSMWWLTPLSFLAMFWYHIIINGSNPFVIEYRAYLKVPFLAWFGYFSIAFLIGKYYKVISKQLLKYRWYTFIGLVGSIAFIYFNYETGVTSVNSRRLDLIPLVFFFTMFVIAWGQLVPKLKIVTLISNYSFGIYLVHWQLQRYITSYAYDFFNNTMTQVVVLFIVSVVLSILIIKLISLLPFGSYIVGRVKTGKLKEISGTKEVAKAS